ncbi:MAG: polysaccharide biosynthesis protein [Candidatus Roizmanbacteria bacterium]|nr:polysaccharide biosynthesis protein [Candidatus Roizmanbacteria bacterium]
MSKNIFEQSTILITGGSGSWGNELTTQLLNSFNPKEIRIYSRGEHKQVEMKRKFQNTKLKFIIGDIRDKDSLRIATKNVDYVFHLSALKHVPVCEENPWEAVKTNIIGTQNIIEVSIEQGVKKVIDVSTDKAVDPLNLYGVTKACGEKLIIAANLASSKTRFICIRGGNVLGTNGSVIPLFREQILKTNQVTITDERMTRFLMRVSEAIKLVLTAGINGVGGEIFVMKMPACKIVDLAAVMIKELGNNITKIINIGIRPGEKIHEILVSKYESVNTLDFGKYYIILPHLKIKKTYSFYKNKKYKKINFIEYSSNITTQLTKPEICKLLQEEHWLTSHNDPNGKTDLTRFKKQDLLRFNVIEGWKNYFTNK